MQIDCFFLGAQLYTHTHWHTRVLNSSLAAEQSCHLFWCLAVAAQHLRQSECHKSQPDTVGRQGGRLHPLLAAGISGLGSTKNPPNPLKQQQFNRRQTGPGRRPGLMSKMRFRRQPEMSCEMRRRCRRRAQQRQSKQSERIDRERERERETESKAWQKKAPHTHTHTND